MKFKDSKTWQNYSQFQLQNRTSVDSFFLYYFIKFFQPKTILEIGFCEGYTCGLYLEARPMVAIDCVDLTFNQSKIFDVLGPQSEVCLFVMDSMQLSVSNTYDFINVDGNHDYTFAKNDIDKSVKLLNPGGIIMIDDIGHPGVNKAVLESIAEKKLTPLIQTDQMVLCMRNGENVMVVPYLNQIKELTGDFLFLDQVKIDKFWVQHLHGPKIWTKFPELFAQVIDLYDL
jgi:predicted O-methyltransferase YrrM